MQMSQHDIRSTVFESLRHMLRFLRWIAAALAALYLLSGLYSISTNEIGVLLRFGRAVDKRVQPGIHYKFPWPVDRVVKVPVKKVNRILIDDFYTALQAGSGRSTALVFSSLTGLDSYCVTGDNNLVNVQCVIQYTIIDPFSYMLEMKDPEIMLRSMACSTIIHCLADMHVDDALTRGKQAVAGRIKLGLQDRLDRSGCGVGVSFVEISDIKPPDRVQEYFSDVVKAGIDYSKMINEAESYFNEKIPAAKADAERVLQEARAYKKRVVLEARGETGRFERLRTRIARGGGAGRSIIYIETLRDILSRVGRKYIVGSGKDGSPVRLNLYEPGEAK